MNTTINQFKDIPDKLTTRSILFLALAFYLLGILAHLTYRHFEHPPVENLVLGSDMEGYYQYLPAFFLRDWEEFNRLPWAKPFGEGKTVSAFTCGVGILQSPFFLMAHVVSVLSGSDTDGYAPLYYISVLLASLFYVTVGLIFLFRALTAYFSRRSALAATLLTFYATNLFYYTIVSPGTSHAYSFFLLAVYLYSVPRFYSKPGYGRAWVTAITLGMATLIRPTNLVAVFYFLLYGIREWQDLRERFRFLISQWKPVVWMLFTGALVAVPQMIYWHYVTGEWIYYSYQDEGFPYWKSPHLGTVLFGARGGWYIYTPVMLAASLLLVWLAWKRRFSAPAILLVMASILWINGSWWAPTFSASAGYRALVEYLPFMAVPLGFGLEAFNRAHAKRLHKLVNILIIVLAFLNIQFAFKYEPALWWDAEWDWAILLRLFQF